MMTDAIDSVAVGAGTAFQLSLRTESGNLQTFELPIEAIPGLVQRLTAIAWASAAQNRPPAGTVLPEVTTYPVKASQVGATQDSHDPVVVVQLFGGVQLGLQFTREAAQSIATDLGRFAGLQ